MLTEPHAECPGLEEIGALAEGRISGAKKSELLRHIDECPDCFEIFTATVGFHAESREQDEPSSVWNYRAWVSRHRIWLATAAVIALALVWYWPNPDLRMAPSRQIAKELTLGIDPLALVAQVTSGGVVSLRFAGGVSESAAVLRTGQALVDLHVLIESEDRKSAEVLAKGLLAAVRERSGWERLAMLLDRLTAGASGSGDDFARGHEAQLEELEEGARATLDPFYLELGKWAESCRIAAGVGSEQFLNRPEIAAFVRKAVSRDTPPPVRNELRALDELFRQRIKGSAALRDIAGRTGDIFALMN